MRITLAMVMAAVCVLSVTGCKKGSSSKAASSKTGTTKSRTNKKMMTAAPTSFKIVVQDEAARTKTAKGVCEGISAARKKRIESLVHVLLNGNPQERVQAANTLSDLCDVMAVPFLMTRVTNDADRNVKLASIAALGHIADAAAAGVLIELLDDEDLGLATAALNALSEMTGGNYAFVNGTTIKIRKAEKAKWEAKLAEGFFKK